MKLHVLGCSGAIAQGAYTSAFLLDDCLLVDAGTGVGELPLEALARIDDVLLSHAHLDHIAALPLLLDATFGLRSAPLRVHALPETLAALRTHIFNGQIWPDFTRIPSAKQPCVTLHPLHLGQTLHLQRHRVEVLPAQHSVPAVGFAVHALEPGLGAWVYGGDSGPNPAFWARVNTLPAAMLVVEVAFAEEEAELARLSQHLCPSLLAQELAQLAPGLAAQTLVGLTHTKPGQRERIRAQVQALGLEPKLRLCWLDSGHVFALGRNGAERMQGTPDAGLRALAPR